MKRPKEPRPLLFWLSIARSEQKSQDFLNRGNDRQQLQLARARKLVKWFDIQKNKKELIAS